MHVERKLLVQYLVLYLAKLICGKFRFIPAHYGIKQGGLYECAINSLHFLNNFSLSCTIPKLGNEATDKYKETFLANMLMMKTHQTLIVEIRFLVLNQFKKDSDENMNSFSGLGSMMNILFVLFSKGTLFDALEGVTSKNCSLEPSYSFFLQRSYLGHTFLYCFITFKDTLCRSSNSTLSGFYRHPFQKQSGHHCLSVNSQL